MLVQAASPNFHSYVISKASVRSHEDNHELLPAVTQEGRRYITSYDPATGLHIGTFLADDEDDIARKIESASQAQPVWRESTFRKRRRVVRSLMKWLVDNQDDVARVACRDTGKTCKLTIFTFSLLSIYYDLLS